MKGRQGFASMNPEKRREVARKGGLASRTGRLVNCPDWYRRQAIGLIEDLLVSKPMQKEKLLTRGTDQDGQDMRRLHMVARNEVRTEIRTILERQLKRYGGQPIEQ
jgi:general stress protein YciG